MKRMLAAVLLATVVCLGSLARPAQAQLSISIDIGTPPPVQRVEVVHEARPGWIWAPGYWAWDGYRYFWVAGRLMGERPGYVYAPGRWEPRGPHWHYVPEHWEPRARRSPPPPEWHHGDRHWDGDRPGWHGPR